MRVRYLLCVILSMACVILVLLVLLSEENYYIKTKIQPYSDIQDSPVRLSTQPHNTEQSPATSKSTPPANTPQSTVQDPFYRPKFASDAIKGIKRNYTELSDEPWVKLELEESQDDGSEGKEESLVLLASESLEGKANMDLADWLRQQQNKITEERNKIQEEKHKLLEEKIRFQKEVGDVMEQIRADEMGGGLAGFLQSSPHHKHNMTRVPDVVPELWSGLNHSSVHQRFPDILFNPSYAPQSFFAPGDPLAAGMQGHPHSLDDLTEGQAEDRFYQLISDTHMSCGDIQRLGNLGDGGWDICVAQPYQLNSGCLVYSFGINFDFSFDDSIATKYKCEVRAFDPSMSTGDHAHSYLVYFYQLGLGPRNTVTEQGWRLQTLTSIMTKLNHLEKPIDVLKLDIEHNEWDCFENMLEQRSLRNVKQLIFELHTPEVYTVRRTSTKQDFIRMYGLLKGLEEQGFRRKYA